MRLLLYQGYGIWGNDVFSRKLLLPVPVPDDGRSVPSSVNILRKREIPVFSRLFRAKTPRNNL